MVTYSTKVISDEESSRGIHAKRHGSTSDCRESGYSARDEEISAAIPSEINDHGGSMTTASDEWGVYKKALMCAARDSCRITSA